MGIFILSLAPALVLGGTIYTALNSAPAHASMSFAILASIVVSVTHFFLLAVGLRRRNKLMLTLTIAMAFVSLACVLLLSISSQPNIEVKPVFRSTTTQLR